MATRQTEALKLVARARQIEWPVETNEGGGFKIICPDGYPVPVHLTQSRAGLMLTEQQLNRRGFDTAVREFEEREEAQRQERLDADRKANERRTKAATARAAALAKAAGPYGQSQVTIDDILAVHPGPMTFTRVMVTPEMAKAMLVRNAPTDQHPWYNRRISPLDVAVWETILRTNRMLYTHQGVAFDWDGRLQDGQTRLTAIEQSGVSAELMISVGMDPRNFAVVDNNRKRTAGQVLQMLGFKDSNPISSAVRLIYLFEVWGSATLDHAKQRIGNDVIVEVADKLDQDDLEWALRWAYRLRREIGGAISAPIAAMYLIRRRLPADDERVTQFAGELIEGVVGEGREASPVYQLRRQMARLAGRTTKTRNMTPAELFALIIKGWNEFAKGGYTGDYLTVRKDSNMPTIFVPAPVGSVDIPADSEPADGELVDA